MAVLDELERLAELRRQGTLSDEEFATAKARVLRGGVGRRSSVLGRLRPGRAAGALGGLVALAAAGAILIFSSGGELRALCEELPSIPGEKVHETVRAAARDSGTRIRDLHDQLDKKCPEAIANARAAAAPKGGFFPDTTPAPAPAPRTGQQPVYEAPQESWEDRRAREELKNAAKAQQCAAQGSDYIWTEFNQCVYYPN